MMILRRVFPGAAALLPLAIDDAFAQAPGVTSVHVRFLAIVAAEKGAPITVTP